MDAGAPLAMTLDGFHRPRLVADPRIASRPRRKVSRSGRVAVRGPFRQRSAHRRVNAMPRPSARPPSDRAANDGSTTRGTLPGAAVRFRPSSRRRARARAREHVVGPGASPQRLGHKTGASGEPLGGLGGASEGAAIVDRVEGPILRPRANRRNRRATTKWGVGDRGPVRVST